MPRRKSIYRMPKLKLRQKTIMSVATLVAFMFAGLSLVSLTTESATLDFWRQLLFGIFGWTYIFSPILFLLSGLVLQKVKWSFAQTNVLLGLILIVLSLASLTTPIAVDQAGSLGVSLWLQLASFITSFGAVVLLVGVLLVGLVVTFNTSLSQIFGIFSGFLIKKY